MIVDDGGFEECCVDVYDVMQRQRRTDIEMVCFGCGGRTVLCVGLLFWHKLILSPRATVLYHAT